MTPNDLANADFANADSAGMAASSETVTNDQRGSASQSQAVPLVLGVTGHRDIRDEDVDALREEVRGVFAEFRAQCPHTPLLLLSPLAEGADRLVARVAVEEGVRLVVPLPMPRELYESDFGTDASRSEFAELAGMAELLFELPLAEGSSGDEVRQPGPQRDLQYAAVGAFVARSSQILLALWDGRDDDEHLKLGGAADVVLYRLGNSRAPMARSGSEPSAASLGQIVQIVTPRAAHGDCPHDALERRELYPGGFEPEAHVRALERLDAFNQDASAHAVALSAARRASQQSLLGSEPVEGREKLVPEAFDKLSVGFAVADTLAGRFASRSESALLYLFGCVLAAALAFNLYHSLPHKAPSGSPEWLATALKLPVFLVAFLVISLVCSTILYRWFAREDYLNKHLDYRALAEGVRVQLVWYMAALKDPVSDHYLDKQRGELAWIHAAVRAWWLVSSAAGQAIAKPSEGDLSDRLELIKERWVDDQARYFGSRAHRERELLERDERLASILLAVSIGLSVLLALALVLPKLWHAHALHELHEWIEGDWVHGAVMIAIVMSAIGAGLIHTYSKHRARAEHARRYAEMSTMFADAGERLGELCRAGQHDDAQNLVRELGEEALAENGDWVLLHRERPLEVPHAV